MSSKDDRTLGFYAEEASAYAGRDRQASVRVVSPVNLDRQIGSDGATWLDRRLIHGETAGPAPTGFGQQVREAMEQLVPRFEHVVAFDTGGLVTVVTRLPIGLTVEGLIGILARRGLLLQQPKVAVLGGPLTGTAIVDPARTVVTAATQGVLLMSSAAPLDVTGCIRCGWCIRGCPVAIDPVAVLDALEAQQLRALPPLAPAELAQAVQLEVAAASPFAAGQTISGYSARRLDPQRIQVDIAITSRQQLESLATRFSTVTQPEIWALPPAATTAAPTPALTPIVLRGFGEGARERRVRQGLIRRLLLLALALALLLALVLTPTILLRGRAQQASQAFAALQKDSAPQQAQREALTQQLDHLRLIQQQFNAQLALPPVLDMLTRTLPDDAWLSVLRVEGVKVVLNGQADDAAALVQRLAAQPGVHDVRLASPATRPIGADKETFIIELKLDANRYGPVLSEKEAAS